MKRLILLITLLAFSFTFSNAQKEKTDKFITINFIAGNETFQKDLMLKTITEQGAFEDEDKVTREFILQKIKLTELKTIDSMFIEGYEILEFNLSYTCNQREEKVLSKTNYFDNEKLKYMRSDCNGAHVWITDFWIKEIVSGKKKLIPSMKLY
jgi:hypothetical protein